MKCRAPPAGGRYMGKQKKRGRPAWVRYEAEKQKLSAKNLPSAEYEQELKKLLRKYRL